MTVDVIFEKRVEEGWQPTRSEELKQGDVARMCTVDGDILCGEDGAEAFEVSGCNGFDPDSNQNFALCLNPME